MIHIHDSSEKNLQPIVSGMMEFMSSDHGIAKDLRKYVAFKFFPVMCPDGVFNGNARCSLIGKDCKFILISDYPLLLQVLI